MDAEGGFGVVFQIAEQFLAQGIPLLAPEGDEHRFREGRREERFQLPQVLFGEGGVLASVDFVTLVLDIEEAVETVTGQSVTLADERAMSQKHSPFRTVGTLAEYIAELLEA